MKNLTQRPALGQIASIGTFYNAKDDSFLPISLLNNELPSDGILRTRVEEAVVNFSYVDSFEERFDRMGVEAELAGSILAGLVDPSGAGCYLGETRESNRILHAAIHHKTISVQEKLDFVSSQVKDYLAFTVLENSEVTHVVIGIEWGAL